MKSTSIIFILLVANILAVCAQPKNMYVKDVVMAPPNAASLGKFGDIPVSYFTGVPSISIPITTLQEGPLTLPISLSYHASGIKISEPAGWVGLSWNLDASSIVSRTIQGLPDDQGGIGYYFVGASILDCADPAGPEQMNEAVIGMIDTEPDIFNFNIGGRTGKFYFDKDKVCQFLPRQDIKFVPYNVNNPFDGFTLIAPEGTRYVFGKTNLPSTRTAYDVSQSTGEASGQKVSWHLLRIESLDKKFAINLYYENESFAYKTPATCKDVRFPFGTGVCDPVVEGLVCSTSQGVDATHLYILTNIEGKRLSQITTSTNIVDFIATTDRQDLEPSQIGSNIKKALDEIKIYTQLNGVLDNTYCHKVNFSYSYYNDPTRTGSEAKRLKLTQIQKVACDGSISEPPYMFTYESGDIPFRLSKQIDHWGFFNGQSANDNYMINIPPTTLAGITVGASNRTASETNIKKGVLKEITYPTGGKTIFTYEANSVKGFVAGNTTFLPSSMWLKSCNNPTDPLCCGTPNYKTNNYTFTGQVMDSVRYKLSLTRLTNLCGGQIPIYVGVTLNILKASDNSVVKSVGFNLAAGQSTYALTGYINSLPGPGTLQNNINYKFELLTTDGFSFYEMFTIPYSLSNIQVGGLRIKEMRNQDAIAASNDMVRTYEYTETTGSLSSGRLIDVFPWVSKYAHTTSFSVFFTDEQVIPLSTHGYGYHVGYERVKETFAGNAIETQGSGYNVYNFLYTTPDFPSTCGFSSSYPNIPSNSKPILGELLSMYQYDNTGVLKSSTINQWVSSVYSLSTGIIVKVQPFFDCQLQPPELFQQAYSKQYQIHQYRPRQIQSTIKSIDGVSTTTTYQYDVNNKYFAPKTITLTNSDNIVTKTKYRYPHDMPNSALRTALLNNNLIATPVCSRNEVAGVDVSGDSLLYSFFSTSGGLPTPTSTGNNPYPYRFYRLERTWNSEVITPSIWNLKGTIESRYTTNFYPKKFLQTGWQKDQYEWGAGGVITKNTYNIDDTDPYKRFVTQYDYYSGTRLLSKITDIDGQFTEFEHDKLHRLSKVKSRKTGSTYNIQATYSYQYKDATHPRNSVRAYTTYTPASGSSLTERNIWQYFDGLGRPVQTIDQKHSPSQLDAVSVISYDNQGRQDTVFNVFQSSLNTGAFVSSVPGGTPYTRIEYYPDPLSRIWKQTPPSWYPASYTYGANAANDVKLDHTLNTWYAANTLNLITIEDPNGNKTLTFKDKKDRLILSRTQNAAGSLKADTYHLYDDKDRLTLVIPPDASITNTNLIFKYQYDIADNMILKDLSDAAPVDIKYNTRDLMTLMRDGNLLSQAQWVGTQYDLYGRAIKNGFVPGSNPDPNNFTISTANTLTETTYDDVAGGQVIYKGKVKQSKIKILDGGSTYITTDFTYDAHGRTATTAANNFTSGTDNHTFTYDWADNILTGSRTHKRLSTDATTTVLETMTYDHAGRIDQNKHKLNTQSQQIVSELNYNVKDELIERNLGFVNSSNMLQSMDYIYNAQGWLTRINDDLGGTNVPLVQCPTAPSMPNPGTASGTADLNDLFFFELKYDALFTGMTSGEAIQKNGNIAQMMWRVRGRDRQAYGFSYDYLDRLTAARYYDVPTAGPTQNNRYSETLAYADKRGNFSSVQHNGGTYAGTCWNFGQIDNLTYTYYSGTNKIKTITDGSGSAKGFVPGPGGDYTYDANGNLLFDPHKSMTVEYNHLNLPKKMTFTPGGANNTIELLYDASGIKLRKIVKNGAVTMYTQDYIDGIEYRDGVREAIYHAEGRVFYTSPSNNRYEYTIKDHLGNTRLTFTDKNGNGKIDVSSNQTNNEILQENHYYPFGMNTEGPWINDAVIDNKYQYNGKEVNVDHGLNWYEYGARWYDSAMARFTTPDPMTGEFASLSTYHYGLNNPLRFIDPTGAYAVTYDGDDARKFVEYLQSRHSGKSNEITFHDPEEGDPTKDLFRDRMSNMLTSKEASIIVDGVSAFTKPLSFGFGVGIGFAPNSRLGSDDIGIELNALSLEIEYSGSGLLTGQIDAGEVEIDNFIYGFGHSSSLRIVRHEVALDMFTGTSKYESGLMVGEARIGSPQVNHKITSSSLRLAGSVNPGWINAKAWAEYNLETLRQNIRQVGQQLQDYARSQLNGMGFRTR